MRSQGWSKDVTKPWPPPLEGSLSTVGVGISNMVQGLSPEVTIVVGNITNAWSLISEELNRSTENAVCQGFPKVNIMPSTLGELPSLMGAFSLVLANKFSSFRIN